MNNSVKAVINQLSNNALSNSAEKNQYNLIIKSGLFDETYYQIPEDELALYDDKLSHYLNIGWKVKLDPSPYFSCQYYLFKNPDVVEEGVNPLIHYIVNGEKEGRAPNVHFNPVDYLTLNPDLVGLESTLLLHYIQFGKSEGRIYQKA